MTAQTYIPIIISPFFAWRVYRRTRRNISRQPLKTDRVSYRIALFAAVSVGYAILTYQYPRVLLGLGGGLSLGGLIALFAGLPLTLHETTSEGHYYKPNAFIGVALSLILVGRIVYRYLILHSASTDLLNNYPGRFQSPLTAFLLGLTTGYYLLYYIGLFVHGRQLPAGSPSV